MTHVSPSQGFSLHHFMTHLLNWHLAPVVKSLHCAAHWLNHHPADQYYGEQLPSHLDPVVGVIHLSWGLEEERQSRVKFLVLEKSTTNTNYWPLSYSCGVTVILAPLRFGHAHS